MTDDETKIGLGDIVSHPSLVDRIPRNREATYRISLGFINVYHGRGWTAAFTFSSDQCQEPCMYAGGKTVREALADLVRQLQTLTKEIDSL
jgi:hypothetical protein